jgi:excisionase family DNA binding protein
MLCALAADAGLSISDYLDTKLKNYEFKPPKKLLPTRTLARRLGVNVFTVRRWAREGRIPFYRKTSDGRFWFDARIVKVLQELPHKREARLDDRLVERVRMVAYKTSLSQMQLGEVFDISQARISAILRGFTYKEAGGPIPVRIERTGRRIYA